MCDNCNDMLIGASSESQPVAVKEAMFSALERICPDCTSWELANIVWYAWTCGSRKEGGIPCYVLSVSVRVSAQLEKHFECLF